MLSESLPRHVCDCSVAITALGKIGKWPLALDVLNDMGVRGDGTDKPRPDAYVYAAAINAVGKAGRPVEVCFLYGCRAGMRRGTCERSSSRMSEHGKLAVMATLSKYIFFFIHTIVDGYQRHLQIVYGYERSSISLAHLRGIPSLLPWCYPTSSAPVQTALRHVPCTVLSTVPGNKHYHPTFGAPHYTTLPYTTLHYT